MYSEVSVTVQGVRGVSPEEEKECCGGKGFVEKVLSLEWTSEGAMDDASVTGRKAGWPPPSLIPRRQAATTRNVLTIKGSETVKVLVIIRVPDLVYTTANNTPPLWQCPGHTSVSGEGDAENAGLENAGPWKIRDQTAGVEKTGLENTGPFPGVEKAGLKNAGTSCALCMGGEMQHNKRSRSRKS